MSAERNATDAFVLFLSIAVKFANNVKKDNSDCFNTLQDAALS